MNINATFLGQTLSFVIFVFCFMKYIWPPLINSIEKRKKEISEGMNFVNQAKKELDLAKEQSTFFLKKAKKEAELIVCRANQQEIKIIEKAKKKAKKESKKILFLAQEEIDGEKKRAQQELYKEISSLIILGTEKVTKQSITELSNENIINKIIKEI